MANILATVRYADARIGAPTPWSDDQQPLYPRIAGPGVSNLNLIGPLVSATDVETDRNVYDEQACSYAYLNTRTRYSSIPATMSVQTALWYCYWHKNVRRMANEPQIALSVIESSPDTTKGHNRLRADWA